MLVYQRVMSPSNCHIFSVIPDVETSLAVETGFQWIKVDEIRWLGLGM
jgi:hypothetical protein